MAAFIDDMATREGIGDFGWHVTSSAGLTQIPFLAKRIKYSPTFLSALHAIRDFGSRESTNIKIWLKEDQDSCFLCYKGSLRSVIKGADQLSLMRTRLVLSVVRMYTDSEWIPKELGLPVGVNFGSAVQETLYNTHIGRTPSYGWIRLPRRVLTSPLNIRSSKETFPAAPITEPEKDLEGALLQFLQPYLPNKSPNLLDAADMAGMSTRSFQRILRQNGTSYRDIVLRHKFNKACELLQQQDLKIVEVALRIGFEDHSHFSRFFKSFSGLTPKEYQRTFAPL
jgi:AraC-like DNA-binding protein